MKPVCEGGNASVCACLCVCGAYAPLICHACWLQTFQMHGLGLWVGARKQSLLRSHQPGGELVFGVLPWGDLWWSLSIKIERPRPRAAFLAQQPLCTQCTPYLPI